MDENRSNFFNQTAAEYSKSMSNSLYFVRTYYSKSWIWSHFQNNTIVCSFSRKLRKWMSCCKITSVCLSFAAKCWRCFTNALMTLRHDAFSRQHRTQDVYAFVLWRYVAVQIWRVKELLVPGIVASTIKKMKMAMCRRNLFHYDLRVCTELQVRLASGFTFTKSTRTVTLQDVQPHNVTSGRLYATVEVTILLRDYPENYQK